MRDDAIQALHSCFHTIRHHALPAWLLLCAGACVAQAAGVAAAVPLCCHRPGLQPAGPPVQRDGGVERDAQSGGALHAAARIYRSALVCMELLWFRGVAIRDAAKFRSLPAAVGLLGFTAGFTLPGKYHAPALGKVWRPGSGMIDIGHGNEEQWETERYLEELDAMHEET